MLQVSLRRPVNAFAKGKLTTARSLHERYYALFKDLFVETNPVPVKAALGMMGLIHEEYRLPLVPLAQKNRELVRATLRQCGVLK